MLRYRFKGVLPGALMMCLAACSGDYSGGAASGGGSTGGTGVRAATMEALFTDQIQPRLTFCRSCHVPGAAADVEDGRDFMLGDNPDADLGHLRASWERLGGNNPTSRILLMASGGEAPHTGGAPWPEGSSAHDAMAVLLGCFGDPDGCEALLAGAPDDAPEDELPLLGSRRGGHAWFDYCAGRDDAAALPADPRSLVRPGVNEGRAVYFNSYWKHCHADPELVGEDAPPATCGELRAQTAAGRTLILGNGAVGAGTFFAGDDTDGFLQIPARDYNNLWRQWGMASRPANFDQLVAERYGLAMGEASNPYPLPGEDPDATDGGSGQLPTGLTQVREPDGTWTGKLGVTCHSCHSGRIGTSADGDDLGVVYGNGNNLSEFPLLFTDAILRPKLPVVGALLPLTVGKTRGTNNALALQIITLLTPNDEGLRRGMLRFYLASPNGGSLDTPAWWNVGSRATKFVDGFLPMGALRSNIGFFIPMMDAPVPFDSRSATAWVREHAREADTYLMSLKSPAYPGDVDPELARQGAILFHSKDLWAGNLDNPAPPPAGGNGSCSSCHGAYSPRYVNDPAWLEAPELAGVSSYIVAQDVIGTNPQRMLSDNEAAEQYGKRDFFAYPETVGTAEDCSTQNRAELREGRPTGYLAPPLHGVWASAPYFHNGSVPDVWGVLDPGARPTIWRRPSRPMPQGQEHADQVVMGYDTDLQRAYDHDRLGWKHEVLQCGDDGATPGIDCVRRGESIPSAVQSLSSLLYSVNPFLWYAPSIPVLTQAQIEQRKVYNTNDYSQSHDGHDFTVVLTDQERRAIIEYLKTL
ncbi:hypothetical protein [Algiphilus sp.]|uniref:c-type cytochrome n=1 Tax=Algiphilus sp. TaxID=1872431 RepID=UPI003C34C8D5